MLSRVCTSIGALCLSILCFIEPAKATTTYTVNKNDTLWTIAMDHGVSVLELKEKNNKTTDTVTVGEQLTIPEGITREEEELLARLVRAEAEGEPYAGKVAVATVVLNRVKDPGFPDSIKEVIYEISPTGNPAFTPVQNGTINKPADEESKKAVKEALAFDGQGHGSLFFYNPEIATNHWIATRETTIVIGNHTFAR